MHIVYNHLRGVFIFNFFGHGYGDDYNHNDCYDFGYGDSINNNFGYGNGYGYSDGSGSGYGNGYDYGDGVINTKRLFFEEK